MGVKSIGLRTDIPDSNFTFCRRPFESPDLGPTPTCHTPKGGPPSERAIGVRYPKGAQAKGVDGGCRQAKNQQLQSELLDERKAASKRGFRTLTATRKLPKARRRRCLRWYY